jgi:hypothetical protein
LPLAYALRKAPLFSLLVSRRIFAYIAMGIAIWPKCFHNRIGGSPMNEQTLKKWLADNRLALQEADVAECQL